MNAVLCLQSLEMTNKQCVIYTKVFLMSFYIKVDKRNKDGRLLLT